MCIDCGERPKRLPAHRCDWCWLAKQPIEKQVDFAERRLLRAQRRPDFVYRARVPKQLWPEGWRWCSGCQCMVPERYVRGSRCRACASQAAHASHVERTYGINEETYSALLRWQAGRCYICGKLPQSKRLAVDHDHRTGAVRGLLCANDEWGCNRSLATILNDLEAAERALQYVQQSPLERMLAGQPAVVSPSPAPRRIV